VYVCNVPCNIYIYTCWEDCRCFWRWFELFVCSQSELTSPLNCFLFVCVLLSFQHLVCLGRTSWDWIYGYESFFPPSLQIRRSRSLSLFPSTSAGFLLLMKGSNSHNRWLEIDTIILYYIHLLRATLQVSRVLDKKVDIRSEACDVRGGISLHARKDVVNNSSRPLISSIQGRYVKLSLTHTHTHTERESETAKFHTQFSGAQEKPYCSSYAVFRSLQLCFALHSCIPLSSAWHLIPHFLLCFLPLFYFSSVFYQCLYIVIAVVLCASRMCLLYSKNNNST